MKTVRLASVLLWVIISPALTAAVSFRLEAELSARPPKVNWRQNASNKRTTHITSTKQSIGFPFCLYRNLTANVTVTYSNDGDSDDVRVSLDDVNAHLNFSSVSMSSGGASWEVFRSVNFSDIPLQRGYHFLTLYFDAVDTYGIEIDYIDVRVDDAFITDDVFRCHLVLGIEPSFAGAEDDRGVSPGYVEQRSYVTPCAEEDNVHLAVYHSNVTKYALSASNPLYRSTYDLKGYNFAACTNFETTYWRFADVTADVIGDDVMFSPFSNKANLTRQVLRRDPNYHVKLSVSFTLKGFKTGFVDADIFSDLKATFKLSGASPSLVKITYEGRDGQEVLLDEFTLHGHTPTRTWAMAAFTWTEDALNWVHLYLDEARTVVTRVELVQGKTAPDTAVKICDDDHTTLQGFRNDFWWRSPVGESMTVKVRDDVIGNLSYVALYMPVPWSGHNSFHQVLVLYQDGNARLVPLPYAAPDEGHWTPFGSSVIIGKSDPAELRPSAPIKTLTFDPETLEMTLDYYDGSSCKVAVTCTFSETTLTVSEMTFAPTTLNQPFATFRSMYKEFGNADSDSVQTDLEGPEHVLGDWDKMRGREFLLYRSVESRRLSQSPDLRIKIMA